jgi:hypothetical protein
MSTVDIDIPSDEHVQIARPTSILMTHQLPSNSIQINTQAMLSSLPQNSELMPIAVIYDRTSPHQSFTSNIREVPEYTLWSIFNVLFGCFILGILAFIASCCTKKKKHRGHLIRAQSFSKIAIILNTVATTSGLMILTLVMLRYSGLIAM